MNEQECLERMVAPRTRRPGKYREGVVQIHVTRACDKACFNCTQGSNFSGRTEFMSLEHFSRAVESLRGYFGVVGIFGGNPATSPHFAEYCEILRHSWVPKEQRGLWCNNPRTAENAKEMRRTFDPSVSNLNVHLDRKAYEMFKEGWPECHPVGLDRDSRHAPVFVAMKDVLRKDCPNCGGVGNLHSRDCSNCNATGYVYDEAKAWELISRCDINQHWSAMVGVFRGELRAWFCEVAGAQAMLHQWDVDESQGSFRDGGKDGIVYSYPDTGVNLHQYLGPGWWTHDMNYFSHQVEKHCHECGVPLRGRGELAMAESGTEQVSQTHQFAPKRKGRRVQTVVNVAELGLPLGNVVRYLQNA